MRLLITLIFLLVFNPFSYSQTKAFWVAAWSITSAEQIDEIIKTAKKHEFNTIYVQSRYRGDALYYPNKTDSTYINNESRCYLLKGSDFDPLQYFIDKSKKDSIKIHAWITSFVITPQDLKKIGKEHIFYQKKDWLTFDKDSNRMSNLALEGAYMDPAIDEACNYTTEVICDIVKNYDLDGIQLDYVRYPDSIYGYNSKALEEFDSSNISSFNDFKRQQVSSFVNRTFIKVKNIKPEIEFSVAVKANYDEAFLRYSQDWKLWLKESYVDKVVLMAYDKSDEEFQNHINVLNNSEVDKNKIVVGLRAWSEEDKYRVSSINSKIIFLNKNNYKNIALYSYLGLVSNHYLDWIVKF